MFGRLKIPGKIVATLLKIKRGGINGWKCLEGSWLAEGVARRSLRADHATTWRRVLSNKNFGGSFELCSVGSSSFTFHRLH